MVVHNDDDDYTILEGYSGFKLTQKCEEKRLKTDCRIIDSNIKF